MFRSNVPGSLEEAGATQLLLRTKKVVRVILVVIFLIVVATRGARGTLVVDVVKFQSVMVRIDCIGSQVGNCEAVATSAAGKGHVGHAVRKAVLQVDMNAVQGHALRLVNGQSPRQVQWVLLASGEHSVRVAGVAQFPKSAF